MICAVHTAWTRSWYSARVSRSVFAAGTEGTAMRIDPRTAGRIFLRMDFVYHGWTRRDTDFALDSGHSALEHWRHVAVASHQIVFRLWTEQSHRLEAGL